MATNQPDNAQVREAPCKCLKSWAMISPTHPGHCCFLPATQTCHQAEMAEWESHLREWTIRGQRIEGTALGATP